MSVRPDDLIRAADALDKLVTNLVRKGIGYALFFCGLASGAAAVALRILETSEITTAVFFGILSAGIFLVSLAAIFFAISVKSEMDEARDLADQAAVIRREAQELEREAREKSKKAGAHAGFNFADDDA